MYDLPLYRPPAEGDNIIIQATLGCSFNQCSFCSMYRSKQYTERPIETVYADIYHAAAQQPEAHRVFLANGDALNDLAILREQERLINGLNPPQPIVFRSNHASNALALAGNLPKDRKKLLLNLREAMQGARPLRPQFMRGL